MAEVAVPRALFCEILDLINLAARFIKRDFNSFQFEEDSGIIVELEGLVVYPSI